ncbi:MAG: hypothetical protein QNK20_01475 [Aureibaculum sp.]|nr:hypothetical protein [Aureibaculum sp.]
MKKRKSFYFVLTIIIFLGITSNINAQLQDVNWYFGNNAGLNFIDSSQDPVALTDGYMNTSGGSASISDENGNLLFYSNGIEVWGADHKTIANGTGLYGSSNVSQSVLIVPNPTNENEYYVFTNQGQETGSLGLHYSIIKSDGGNNDDDDNDDNDDSSDGSKLSTGVVSEVSSTWKTVSLPNNYNSMVVVATPNYTLSQTDPMVVRIRNASGNTFQVRAESAGGTETTMDVHYMVVEEGVYEGMEAIKYNSTITDQDNSWVGETRTYTNSYTNPVVLGQVMTYNDEGFSTFWSRGTSRSNPPSASYLKTGKHVAQDSDTSRNNETIGYIVIEAGSGTLNGINYSAAVGADQIDHNEKTYSINHTGASIAVATLTAMDGSDGGWAVLSSTSPISGTALKLSIDEDIIKDSETNHTKEQVAYIVFSNSTDDNDDDGDIVYCNDKKTKVSICHNGNNTLCVSINALQAHLDHGDTMGSCDDNDDDGETEFAVTTRNILLLPTASEKLTAIYNEEDNSYWVVSFAPSNDPVHNDTFYSFKVGSTGVSYVEESTFDFLPMNNENTGGQMKISSDLTTLGLTHNTIEIGRDGGLDNAESIFTFDFDNVSGSVTNKITYSILNDKDNGLKLVSSSNGFDDVHSILSGVNIKMDVVSSVYGFEFSPNSNIFYISSIEQIDYNTSDITPYSNLLQILYRDSGNSYSSSYSNVINQIGTDDSSNQVYSLQLGCDGKIYAADNSGSLDQISNPDGLSAGAGYKKDHINLNGKTATKGLPQSNQIFKYDTSDRSSDTKKSIIKGNPFRNELIIDLAQTKKVEFYNERGAMVKLVVFNNSVNRESYNLDTSDLPVGIYFLVIEDEQSQIYNETVFKTD